MKTPILLVGEIFIDVTINTDKTKMRLGGIVHAARGLWASEIDYCVAAIYPSYLDKEIRNYLKAHGCSAIHHIADVKNSPNVIFLYDEKETSHQGYENILRNQKEIEYNKDITCLCNYDAVVIYPGDYSLATIFNYIEKNTSISIDIAYGVKSLAQIPDKNFNLELLTISTSSELFLKLTSKNYENLAYEIKNKNVRFLLVKENRGGSVVYDFSSEMEINLPAYIDETVNSVGVGDVFTAVMAAKIMELGIDSAWRGLQAATCYAKTTFVDDFKRNLNREYMISISELQSLLGVRVPWSKRKDIKIYLAAPDFTYIDTHLIEQAVSSFSYHNFDLIRPVKINGELSKPANLNTLKETYDKDIHLLLDCDLVFAIPLSKDPGTLVEIGYALAINKPVIVYDPLNENDNTMVIGGANAYSNNLDIALNATFITISDKMRIL
ncbi:nucleoside 2-deoxyribosyltransferase [Pantoea ananatis]|uniref:nucleoside 2-deoxyribosyltransferase n=1 Tax=Pantoea ananas TaxID=553 RepID=UPI001303D81B|nr:nucleoside 2-deoxyribosyltransferase [Pantoea ananatis]